MQRVQQVDRHKKFCATVPVVREELAMLQSTVVLFVAALMAGAIGFSSVAATVSDVANVMLFAFVVLFVTRDLLERTRVDQPMDQALPAGNMSASRRLVDQH